MESIMFIIWAICIGANSYYCMFIHNEKGLGIFAWWLISCILITGIISSINGAIKKSDKKQCSCKKNKDEDEIL